MKILKQSIILVLFIMASSCQDNFLEEEVFSSISTELAFENPEDALRAVNGIYAGFQSENYMGRNVLHIGDLAGGTARGYFPAQYDAFLFDDTGRFSRELYIEAYRINLRANNVIENVPLGNISQDLKDRYVAEAKFLRALNYFYLVRMFDHIPLVLEVPRDPTDPQSLIVSQNDRDEVYATIIEDLEFARSVLPNQYDEGYGRATWGAATALLGKVYLTYAGFYADYASGSLLQGNAQYFTNAESLLRELVNSGLYNLENDYRNVFDNATEDSNSENIFSIRFLEGTGGFEGLGGEGTTYPTQHAPKNSGLLSNEYITYASSMEFYNSFDNGDNRVPYTFLDSYVNGDGAVVSVPQIPLDYPHINKYLFENIQEGPNPTYTNINDGDYGDDFIVIRYADVLLMLAEAINENSPGSTEALTYLNQVRLRAGLNTINNANQQAISDAIFIERRKELCFEGHAWFDLIRTGRFLEFIQNSDSKGANNVTERNRLFPIPSNVILTNPGLVQNFGY